MIVILVIIAVIVIVCMSKSTSSRYCPNSIESPTFSAEILEYKSTGKVPTSYYKKIGSNTSFDNQIYEAARLCKENVLRNYANAQQKGNVKEVFAGSFLCSWFPNASLGEQKARFTLDVYVAYTNFDVVGSEGKIGGKMLFKILEHNREASYSRIAPNEYHKALGRLSSERYNIMEYVNESAFTEIEKAFNTYGLSVCFSTFRVEGLDYMGKMMYVYAYVK